MRHFTPLCARSSLICNKIRKRFRRVWIIYPPQKRLNGLATTQRIWLNLRFISSREPMYATFPRSNWHKKRCASAVTGANKNRASVHSIQTDARLYYTCGSVVHGDYIEILTNDMLNPEVNTFNNQGMTNRHL